MATGADRRARLRAAAGAGALILLALVAALGGLAALSVALTLALAPLVGPAWAVLATGLCLLLTAFLMFVLAGALGRRARPPAPPAGASLLRNLPALLAAMPRFGARRVAILAAGVLLGLAAALILPESEGDGRD